MRAAAVQSCDSVRGFERLCALSYGKIRTCRSVGGCGDAPPCTPVRVDCGRYTLLWGARPVVEGEEDEGGEVEDYSASPFQAAWALLRENARHQVEEDTAATPNSDFKWRKASLRPPGCLERRKACFPPSYGYRRAG